MSKTNRSREKTQSKHARPGRKYDSKKLTLTLRIDDQELIEILNNLKEEYGQNTYSKTIKEMIRHQKEILEGLRMLSNRKKILVVFDSDEFDEIISQMEIQKKPKFLDWF